MTPEKPWPIWAAPTVSDLSAKLTLAGLGAGRSDFEGGRPSETPVDPCIPNPIHVIHSQKLFKLRTAVARHGEQDVANWWPTQGLLARQGASLYQRSFPRTHPFARARVVAEAAKARVRELYPVKDALTLWTLPTDLEEQVELDRQEWLRDVERWTPFFERLEAHEDGDLLDLLQSLELVRDSVAEAARSLTPPANGPALPLSKDELTAEGLELLAAAHAAGRTGAPVVPHLGTRHA